MIVLRCTRRLLKGSGFLVVAEPPASDLPLGEWYADVVPLPFPGRSVVMYTSSKTLLTVVAPGRALRTTIPIFQQRLPALLSRLQLPAAWVARHAAGASEVCIARTDNRQVLGSMNELAYMMVALAEDASSFGELDLDGLELRLSDTLMGMFGYGRPANITAELARQSTGEADDE
jgi:hypothetical protein